MNNESVTYRVWAIAVKGNTHLDEEIIGRRQTDVCLSMPQSELDSPAIGEIINHQLRLEGVRWEKTSSRMMTGRDPRGKTVLELHRRTKEQTQ